MDHQADLIVRDHHVRNTVARDVADLELVDELDGQLRLHERSGPKSPLDVEVVPTERDDVEEAVAVEVGRPEAVNPVRHAFDALHETELPAAVTRIEVE